MVEYGHAVADGAGKASGSHGGGGGGGDWGAQLNGMVTDAAHQVSILPLPAQVLLVIGVTLVSLLVLRKVL